MMCFPASHCFLITSQVFPVDLFPQPALVVFFGWTSSCSYKNWHSRPKLKLKKQSWEVDTLFVLIADESCKNLGTVGRQGWQNVTSLCKYYKMPFIFYSRPVSNNKNSTSITCVCSHAEFGGHVVSNLCYTITIFWRSLWADKTLVSDE